MVLLSCHCRNVVIEVNEMPKAFTQTEYANRINLLPRVDPEDEAFCFVGSNETMAPVKLALGGVKVVYPNLLIARNVETSILYKCAVCAVYTHATDHSQQESQFIVVNVGLEKDPMKLRQSENYSPVFGVIIDEQRFANSAQKIVNANLSPNRSDVAKNMIAEIRNRSSESCQRKQKEVEEKIRQFTIDCNKEYEEFQKRVNRDRDSLIGCIKSLVLPDDLEPTQRTLYNQQQQKPANVDNRMDVDGVPSTLRWPANTTPDVSFSKQRPVLSQPDLDDMDMVYGDGEPTGPAFDVSDDSNSSNESNYRPDRARRARDIAQSAPMKVPVFHHRKSSDDDEDYEDNGRPFDFRRMTLEAASLSRFTNKSVVSDGTELFGPIPDSGSNPPV